MKKRLIRLTETDLQKIIENSVIRIINENNELRSNHSNSSLKNILYKDDFNKLINDLKEYGFTKGDCEYPYSEKTIDFVRDDLEEFINNSFSDDFHGVHKYPDYHWSQLDHFAEDFVNGELKYYLDE